MELEWRRILMPHPGTAPMTLPGKSKLTVLITESNETHMQTRSQIKTEMDYGGIKERRGTRG